MSETATVDNSKQFITKLEEELQNCIPLLKALPDDREKKLIRYTYCSADDCFYISHTTGGSASSHKLLGSEHPLNGSLFKRLFAVYERIFIPINMEIEGEFSSYKKFMEFKKGWLLLYNLFISPWIKEEAPIHFLVFFDCDIENKRYYIDFNSLYNLRFRFLSYRVNKRTLFTNITTASISTYLSNLAVLKFPVPAKMALLYGFKKTPEEQLMEKIFFRIKQVGGKVFMLNTLSDLEDLLKKGNEDISVHLLAHYHNGRIFTRSTKSIKFSNLKTSLDALKRSGLLRDDIILEANTCRNFEDFKQLYDHGIKYLHMSRHDILGSLAIYTLYELLTGTYAEKIGWPFPYLDGNSYLHEALANVSRCFYAMTALSQEKNYTMNTITIAGNDLPDFLDFVETELEKDKSAASSKYDGLDYEEESTENPKIFSVEIIGLLLTGTIQVITTMIIEYFKHKLNSGKNSEITLKRENDTVNISSVTFKGLSQEEAEKKLKELIPTTGHKGN